MKVFLKHTVESLLIRSGFARHRRARRGGLALVLAYHNVVPDDDAAKAPDSLHLAKSDFLRQLDLLERFTEVIPLEDLDSAVRAPPGARPKIVLTFDDAYAGAMHFAVPELVRRGLPATVFVCPGLLHAEGFWWDSFDATGRENQVFQKLAADHTPVWSYFTETGAPRKAHSDWRRPAAFAVLEPYLGAVNGPIRFGGHTWTHPNLAALSDLDVRAQLFRTMQWLEREVARPSRWLACPYGFNSSAVGREAEALGYSGALEISGGWVRRTHWDRYSTPRLNVPAGVSQAGFELRISGVIER